MSRSFSCAVADREAQVAASGWPCRERARHEAAAQEALGRARPRAPAEPKSTSRKFVTLGPTDQPAAVSASAQAAALGLDACEVGLEDRRVEQRLGHDRHRDRRHRARRPVRVRCVAMTSRLGDREPDAQAGERVGLAGGPDDDEPRVASRAAGRAVVADELGVGLVEDDDRRRPAPSRVRRRVGEAVEQAFDRAVGLGEAGRVVRAAQPDDGRLSRAAARTAATSSAQPASRPEARDGDRPRRRAAR